MEESLQKKSRTPICAFLSPMKDDNAIVYKKKELTDSPEAKTKL